MSKKRFRVKMRQVENPLEDQQIKEIFLGQGEREPLTGELIKALVEKGIPKNDLEHMAELGFTYSRATGSFFQPAEQEENSDDEQEEREKERIMGLLNNLPDWKCGVIVALGKDDEVLCAAISGTEIFNMYMEALVERFHNPGRRHYNSDILEMIYGLDKYKEWN